MKQKKSLIRFIRTISLFGLIVCAAFSMARAQVASGGSFSIEQSVIASGGGQNTSSGNFTLDGTIGQSIAGNASTGSTIALWSGFWTPELAPPTAAVVSISGRVIVSDGRGLLNARVILTETNGTTRTTLTSTFGNFRFDEIEIGQTVIITIVSKRFEFQAQVITVSEEIKELNFISITPF